jgi:hypothetical protein
MLALEFITRALLAVGTLLVIGGLALDVREAALVGVGCWFIAAALVIAAAGPHRHRL